MKFFRTSIIILALSIILLACLFLFAGKNKAFGRKFIAVDRADNYFHGDLYNYCEIPLFKENIVETELVESKTIFPEDSILMGDSFFNTGFDSLPVPNYLQEIKNQNVFYKALNKDISPLEYLKQINYQKGEDNYFIWETVERKSLERGLNLNKDFELHLKQKSSLNKIKWDKLNKSIFDRVDAEYFIKNNIIIKPFRVWLKNIAFNWFGDIDNKTPAYSADPKMLFFNEEISFNENSSKLLRIEEMADNIAREASLIKEYYNLTLVYVVIPNKFSIYNDLIKGGKQYDEYIPNLHRALSNRGVDYIDVYQEFLIQKEGQLLYYVGDTHFNKHGKQILVDLLDRKINQNISP